MSKQTEALKLALEALKTERWPVNPHKPLKGKGQTKYDQQFEKMLQHKIAIEIHEDNFEAMRRALMRFREYRNLKGKLTIRQRMNSETRMVTLWFEMKDEMQ